MVERKGQIISFWANADEAEQLKKKSKEQGRSKSNFIRFKLFKGDSNEA